MPTRGDMLTHSVVAYMTPRQAMVAYDALTARSGSANVHDRIRLFATTTRLIALLFDLGWYRTSVGWRHVTEDDALPEPLWPEAGPDTAG